MPHNGELPRGELVLCPHCGNPVPEGMWACPCKKSDAAPPRVQPPATDEAALAWKVSGTPPAPRTPRQAWRAWNVALAVGLLFLVFAIVQSLRGAGGPGQPDQAQASDNPAGAAVPGRCGVVDETLLADGSTVRVEGHLTNHSRLVLGSTTLQTEFVDAKGRALGVAWGELLAVAPGKTTRYRTAGAVPVGIDTPQPIAWRTRVKDPRWLEANRQ